jgi:hypothetical protein
MNDRRAYLKQLAARSAGTWAAMHLPSCFAGETRIQTRNTIYKLRDGVCYAMTHRDPSRPPRATAEDIVGMRIVGWMTREDPGMSVSWRPGAHAVLWRPREEDDMIALTSTSVDFRQIARVVRAVPSAGARPRAAPALTPSAGTAAACPSATRLATR